MEARFDENGIVFQLRPRATAGAAERFSSVAPVICAKAAPIAGNVTITAGGQCSDLLRGAYSFRLVDHLDGLRLNLFGHFDQRRLLRQR